MLLRAARVAELRRSGATGCEGAFTRKRRCQRIDVKSG